MILLFALLGCNREGGNECNAEQGCGFGETCENGFCKGAVCNTSRDCPIEAFCGGGRTCRPGCEFDADCYPGDQCDPNSKTCEVGACEDTQIDCGYRQFCNLQNGDCIDAGDNYCKPCTEDFECGGGNYCIGTSCGVDCSGGKECPSGFECIELIDSTTEQTVAFQCFTYCDLYDDFDPGSFRNASPVEIPKVIRR